MSPFAPNETSTTIFLERTFVAGDVIVGTGFGIQLMLYLACARILWARWSTTKRRSLYILMFITVLIVTETIFVAVQARTVEDMYVDNRNYPGGPWAYFLATQYLAEDVLFIATTVILTSLADALVLYRCWVVWTAAGRRSTTYIALFVPTLVLLASIAMGILWALQSTMPGLSIYSKLPMAYGTSYYATSIGLNIVLTVLIAARLLSYRAQIAAVLPRAHAAYYVSLAGIFVESAAVYSVPAVLFLATYAANSPLNQVFLACTSIGQQVAAYLIIYRVAEGSDFRGSALEGTARPEVSTMQFGSRPTRSSKPQTSTFMSVLDMSAGGTMSKMVFASDKSHGETDSRGGCSDVYDAV